MPSFLSLIVKTHFAVWFGTLNLWIKFFTYNNNRDVSCLCYETDLDFVTYLAEGAGFIDLVDGVRFMIEWSYIFYLGLGALTIGDTYNLCGRSSSIGYHD